MFFEGLKGLLQAVMMAQAGKLNIPATPGPARWFGQHTNPAANVRRKTKKQIGARQYRKQRKALAQAAREPTLDLEMLQAARKQA